MYTNIATRKHPGLFILMVDQSGFMSNESVANGKPLAVIAADSINSFLTFMVRIATRPIDDDDEEVRDYQKVIVIGYGGNGYPYAKIICNDWLSEIPDYELYNTTSFNFSLDVYKAIEPVSEGISPMASAFELVKQVINEWKASGHDEPEDPSPIIINITNEAGPTDEDGYVTEEVYRKTYEEAQAVMNISFPDGAPRICNIVLSSDYEKEYIFPNNDLGYEIDSLMQFYFNISSKMPDNMRKRLYNYYEQLGITLKENSKLLIMGGNIEVIEPVILNFSDWCHWSDIDATIPYWHIQTE